MRLLASTLVAPLVVLVAPTAAAQLSIATNLPGTFIDISGTGTPLSLSDDAAIDIPTTIGNALFPAGTARVGSNGAVRFRGAGTGLAFTNASLPSAGVFSLTSQSLLPFWDDINTAGGTLGEIYWQETGGMLIVQWHDVSFFSAAGQGTARFQLQVPSSGTTWARFLYPDITQARPNGGGSATIGYQAGGWGNDVQFSFNTPGAVTNGSVLSLVGTFTPPPPPPANDDCAGAIVLTLNSAVNFDNTWATNGTQGFACATGEADLWYAYTANSGNTVIVSTCGSSINTILEVFTGTCAGLTSLRCNNDFCGTQSTVSFVGSPGTTYRIHVGSVGGSVGQGTIVVNEAPPPSLSIVSNLPGTWIDISGTGTPLGLSDDASVDIATTIGNSLFAAGTARVGSNGCVRFAGAGTSLAFTNASIPASGAFGLTSQVLLGFWDDINTVGGTVGEIYWQETQGRLIVQWQAAGFFGAATELVTFQIQVPSSGPALAQFLYQDVQGVRADGGGSATIGYQAGSPQFQNDVEWSFNTSGAVSNGTVLSLVMGSGGTIGTNYCTANTNSTGSIGQMSASGSSIVANNDLVLRASSLPNAAFGYFITSRTQGFVMGPGGSQGNLCLGGAIGRYVAPGQIQNTGQTGTLSLALNLNLTPTPLGFVAVVAGDTWNYQAWHRDSFMGNAVSNFTNGLSVLFH